MSEAEAADRGGAGETSAAQQEFPTAAFVVLLVVYGAVLCINIYRPWIGAHDWNGVAWSTAAHNLLTRALSETHGGVSLDHGASPLSQQSFYVHHPPLVIWLMTGAYRMFGESEAVGRTVPIVFSLAAVFFLARLLHESVGPTSALLGAAFFAMLPSQTYYGRMPNHEPLGLSAMLAAAWMAWRWARDPSWRWATATALAVVVACLCCWPAYIFALLLGWSSLRIHRPSRAGLFLAVGAASALTLVTLVVHIRMVRADGVNDLLAAFLLRSGSAERAGGDAAVEWSATEFHALVRLLSPIGVALLAFQIVRLFRPQKVGRPPRGFSEIVLLPLTCAAWGNVLLFRQGAFVHEYYCYYLGGPVGLLAGLVLGWSPQVDAARRTLVGLILGATAIHGIATLHSLHKQQSTLFATAKTEPEDFVQNLAAMIATEFPSDATILVDALPIGEQLGYYSNRRTISLLERKPDQIEKDLLQVRGAVINRSAPGGEAAWNRLLEMVRDRPHRISKVRVEPFEFGVLHLNR
jgi:hypothetical protein